MNRLTMTLPLALGLLAGAGCSNKPVPALAAEPPEPRAGEGLRLPLKDLRGLRFLVVPEPRAEGAWHAAEAIGDEAAQALLTAPVKGILAAILVPPGRQVGTGTGLLVLRSPELARLKADWLSASARRERAEAELAREQRLFAGQAGSRRDLEVARAEGTMAVAEAESARLALEARGVEPATAGATLTLRAPKAGTVTAYKAQLGQGVEAGQELGGFQSASAAIARLELPLPAPKGWNPGAVTEARSSDGQHWRATLVGTPVTLTADTRRLSYRLRLSGGVLPIPGTPLEIQVPLATAIVLPQSALQQVEGTWGVFVKEGDGAVFRPVRRGPELGGEVMVLEGVQPGATVIGEGAYLLKALQIKRKSGGDSHEH
jgi:cobalt-zinc-cadmium efflux system membrane fusion protein